MDNPSQEKIISDSESLGSQDSWSTENSDSQDSINSWLTDSSCSQDSFICEDNYTIVEEFWNGAEEKKQ